MLIRSKFNMLLFASFLTTLASLGWFTSLELSEAALTGKPIYIANILPKKNDRRFQKFRNLFRELNITRNLGEPLESWSYEKLDETNRVANIIKQKINS